MRGKYRSMETGKRFPKNAYFDSFTTQNKINFVFWLKNKADAAVFRPILIFFQRGATACSKSRSSGTGSALSMAAMTSPANADQVRPCEA